MTPALCLFREFGVTDCFFISTHKNKTADAKPLLAYVEVIQETAKQFNIPVLDLYHNLGIDTQDQESNERYTIDGLHFNDAGHEILALRLKEFIESL